MFGHKFRDGTKEFEQMRQAGRFIEQRSHGEPAPSATEGPPAAGTEGRPMSNITVAPAAQPAEAKAGPAAPEDCSSIVSTGSTWNGNLKIEGSVRIDGHLSGEIDAKGLVLVSEGAEVDAKVRAAFVVIAGAFKGQVECSERLEVMPTGRITAELATKSLVVHEGAFVEGQVRMSDARSAAAGAPAARSNGAAAMPGRPGAAAPATAAPVG